MSEINRISEQTDFNGVKVLSSDQKLTIQVGANDGETIDIDLQKIDSTKLGLDGFDVIKVLLRVLQLLPAPTSKLLPAKTLFTMLTLRKAVWLQVKR